jgi:hypothetical protein
LIFMKHWRTIAAGNGALELGNIRVESYNFCSHSVDSNVLRSGDRSRMWHDTVAYSATTMPA